MNKIAFVFLILSLFAFSLTQAAKFKGKSQTKEMKRFWHNQDIYCHTVCANTHKGYVCPARDGNDFAYQCAKTQEDCITWHDNYYTCPRAHCMPWLYALQNYIVIDC